MAWVDQERIISPTDLPFAVFKVPTLFVLLSPNKSLMDSPKPILTLSNQQICHQKRQKLDIAETGRSRRVNRVVKES